MQGDDRTEAATPRRRGEARKKGQVPKSSDLSSIFVLMGLLLALHGLFGGASQVLTVYFQQVFGHLDDTRLSPSLVMKSGADSLLTLAKAIGPLLLIAMVLGTLINIVQTGPLWALEALKPSFTRLNPLTGCKRFVSSRALVDLVKAIGKITLIAYIAYATIQASYPQLLLMARLDLFQSLPLIGEIAYRLALRVVGAMLVLAALDYAYQRWSHEKSLRMTKKEVKDEFKQMEGDPRLKARIRARQRQLARQRMMEDIPKADVVITNPTHFAVALKYDTEKMIAPMVVAKGQDFLAIKIRTLAQEHDVPIVENPPLARALYQQVPIGREIPAGLYGAVAEVLAFVYQINQRRRERWGLAEASPR